MPPPQPLALTHVSTHAGTYFNADVHAGTCSTARWGGAVDAYLHNIASHAPDSVWRCVGRQLCRVNPERTRVVRDTARRHRCLKHMDAGLNLRFVLFCPSSAVVLTKAWLPTNTTFSGCLVCLDPHSIAVSSFTHTHTHTHITHAHVCA